MPQHKSTITEFPLPDDWEPEGTVCVTVPVPDDPQYVAMLVGLLDWLKLSRSFARDATATGAAIVSRTWQAALESQPIIIGECDVMSYDTRVHPDFPWMQQASSDGGETWHTSLIQPNWSNAIGAVFPVASDSDEAGALAGGIIAGGPEWFVQRVIDRDGDGFSRDQIVNDIYAEMARLHALPDGLNKIGPMVDTVLDLPTPTVYADDCVYVDFWESLRDFMLGHPTDFGNLLGNWFSNAALDFGDAVVVQFAELYGSLGKDALYYQLANNVTLRKATFGLACTWEHEFDFTTGAHGWSPYNDGSVNWATYVPGSGWAIGPTYGIPQIVIDLPEVRDMTAVDYVISVLMNGNYNGWYLWFDGTFAYDQANVLTHTLNSTKAGVTNVRLALDPSTGSGDSYPGYITSVTLRGVGLDPF
jgi:hypothetical protein